MTTPAKRTNDEVEVPRELDPITQAIVNRAVSTGHYGGGTAFLLQALSAETIEQATTIGTVLSAKDDVLGERLRIMDVTFIDSDPDLESPIPLFAVIDCVREMSGERVKVSCGASHVLGVLIRACEMDWFPFDAELVSVGLGAGRKAINLNLAPTRVDTITEPL
jgi:hypothetical protein